MATKTKKFGLTKPGGVRTRFAPSPTGFLHIGSARTALFNYLLAKKNKGRFILRIEDTDTERSKPEFEKDIFDNLIWLGIKWDEGPIATAQIQNSSRILRDKIQNYNYIGDYGPYRQSERKEIYKKYLEKLLKDGKSYYCFCSKEELEAKKQEQMSRGLAPKYDGKCAPLSKDEIKRNLSQNKKFIIRLKVPEKKIEFVDIIRGKVEFDVSLLGDFGIAKDLENPLYNFAAVIDDYEMKISHVIRGEDHISNTPKQILIQEALGFPQPIYGHLPLILGQDRSKLSKRHGAVSVAEYKKDGYLPEALVNFLAFLGWNPGDEREIFSLATLIKEFSLEKVHKGGAIFNTKKLDFINGFYIRKKTIDNLTELCIPYLVGKKIITPISESKEKEPKLTEYFGKEYTTNQTGEKINIDYLKKIVAIYQERIKKLSEIAELTNFFFQSKLNYNKDLLKWKGMDDMTLKIILNKLEKTLSGIENKKWNAKNLQNILLTESEKTAKELQRPGDRGHLLWPLRAALSGQKSSAGPFDIAEILGKEKTLSRIKEADNLLK